MKESPGQDYDRNDNKDMIKVMMAEIMEMKITDLLLYLVILNSILLYFF